MSVRTSVFEAISGGPALAWPVLLLLAPLLAVAAVWNRFYRDIRVAGVSEDWLSRHRQESRKH